jgi:hypothetical protein
VLDHIWIAETNIEPEAMFGIITLLFSIADTGTKGAMHRSPPAMIERSSSGGAHDD